MTYQQVLENARTCIGPYCKACNDCNGKVCRNTMPGPGAKGEGTGLVSREAERRRLRVRERLGSGGHGRGENEQGEGIENHGRWMCQRG